MSLCQLYQYSVLAVTDKLVHVVETSKGVIKHILIHASYPVVVAAATPLSVIIATCDNKLWEVPASVLSLTQQKTVNENHRKRESEEDMDSEDIFGDLLTNDCSKNEDGTNHGRQKSADQKLSVYQDTSVVHIMPDYLLYTTDGKIIDITASESLIALFMDGYEEEEILIFQYEAQIVERNSPAVKRIHLLQRLSAGVKSRPFYNTPHKRRNSLFIVVTESLEPLNLSGASSSKASFLLSPKVILLSRELFATLFGKDATCFNSPVLILCKGNCVYSYTLKCAQISSRTELSVICQMNSEVLNILPVHISDSDRSKNLLQGSNDIIAALSSALGKDLPNSASEAIKSGLTVFTTTGDGCLFVPQVQHSVCPLILKFSLSHHLQACTLHKESIIYSTGTSIESCQLKLTYRPEGKCFSVTPVVNTILKRARIHQLLPFSLCSDGEGHTVTGITSDFEAVPIPTLVHQNPSSAGDVVQSSLKTILSTIDQHSQKLVAVKEKGQVVNMFLQQLNVMASLVQIQKAEKERESRATSVMDSLKPFLSCQFAISAVRNLYCHNWSLQVTLDNTSDIVLSKDWVVVVTVCNSKCDTSPLEHAIINKTYSCQLSKGLKSMSSVDLRIPLDDVISFHPIPPLELSVSLWLTLKNISHLVAEESVPQKALKVNIHKQSMDILHFLHLPDNHRLSASGSGHDSIPILDENDRYQVHHELRKMASDRIRRHLHLPNKSQTLVVKIGVLQSVCEEHRLFNPTDILVYLLQGSCIPPSAVTGSSCQLQDAHGSSVAITVNPVSNGHATLETSDILEHGFVITLRGIATELLLQVRAAIKSRLTLKRETEDLQLRSIDELKGHLTSLQRVKEGLQVIQNKLESPGISQEESALLVCEMLEKSEMLPKSS